MAALSFIERSPASGFLEQQLASLLGVLEFAQRAERLAQAPGLLQRFDPRVRLLGLLAMVTCTVSCRGLPALGLLFLAALALALLSRLPLRVLAQGVWLNVALFTGALALPAIFLVPGETWVRLPLLGWGLTRQGVVSALLLLGRAMTASTFAAVLVLVTPWPQLLAALRGLRLPAVLVLILGMSHRYLFLLLQLSLDLFEARRSRQLGRLTRAQQRRMLLADAGVLLGKSLHLAEEVYLAMRARGYRGRHHSLRQWRLGPGDWAALAASLLAAALMLQG